MNISSFRTGPYRASSSTRAFTSSLTACFAAMLFASAPAGNAAAASFTAPGYTSKFSFTVKNPGL